jgi:hypothetical protein
MFGEHIAYAKRMLVPTDWVSTPQEDPELGISHAVSRLWVYIQLADQEARTLL